MNRVFISGIIAGIPQFKQAGTGAAHLALPLSVRHTTRAGETRREIYRVSAWNNLARWGAQNLVTGQHIGLSGYLTQRQTGMDEKKRVCIEIAAIEFFPIERIQNTPADRDAPPA